MSENTSDQIKKRERPNLTDYQKHLIIFLATELNMDIDKIREHDKLRTEDGKPILKKTIIYWLNRFKETGDLKVKDRSGRPRLLTGMKEKRLIKYIQNNSEIDYQVIKEKLKLNMTRRTVNNYALRNEIRSSLLKDGKSIRKKTETENVTTSLPQNPKSNISSKSIRKKKETENVTLPQNSKSNISSSKRLSERKSRRSLAANVESNSLTVNQKQNATSSKTTKRLSSKRLLERRSRRSLAGDENIAMNHNRSYSVKK